MSKHKFLDSCFYAQKHRPQKKTNFMNYSRFLNNNESVKHEMTNYKGGKKRDERNGELRQRRKLKTTLI